MTTAKELIEMNREQCNIIGSEGEILHSPPDSDGNIHHVLKVYNIVNTTDVFRSAPTLNQNRSYRLFEISNMGIILSEYYQMIPLDGYTKQTSVYR